MVTVLFAELVLVLGGWKFAPAAMTAKLSTAPAGVSNTAAIGRLLYTDYIFLFQAAGLVLLVAMIGAIVLTLRDRKTSRHQVIRNQNERRVEDTLEMVDVAIGAGIDTLGIYRPKPAAAPVEHEDGGHGHSHSGAHHAPEVR